MAMVDLDPHEQIALDHFLRLFEQERFEHNPQIDRARIVRGKEGQILLPVTVSGTAPDLHLAMLMSHKADQIYKQTGCRFVLVQRPAQAPTPYFYAWVDEAWRSMAEL